MRSLVYYTTITLDGYFSGPDGDLEYFEPSEAEHQYANDLRTLASVDDKAVLASDDIIEEVSRLKQRDGGYLMLGSVPSCYRCS